MNKLEILPTWGAPLKDIVATTQQDPYREGKQSQPARPVRSILVVRYLENNNSQAERILNLQI